MHGTTRATQQPTLAKQKSQSTSKGNRTELHDVLSLSSTSAKNVLKITQRCDKRSCQIQDIFFWGVAPIKGTGPQYNVGDSLEAWSRSPHPTPFNIIKPKRGEGQTGRPVLGKRGLDRAQHESNTSPKKNPKCKSTLRFLVFDPSPARVKQSQTESNNVKNPI